MKRFLRPALALLATLLAVPAAADVPVGELPATAEPVAYRIDLEVDPTKASFAGTTEIDLLLKEGAETLYLHGLGLSVTAAEALTGRMVPNAITYREVHPTGVAELRFARPLPPGKHTLRFRYTAPFQTATSGLYKAEVAGKSYAWTQFQAIDARRVFPGFDEPRHKTPFTVSITVPKGNRAFANAPEASATSLPDGRVKHQFASFGPSPTYLLAMAVGPFDVVEGVIPPNAIRKRPLAFRAIATEGQAKRLAFTMRETPKILPILEDWFGTEYPWSKLDVIASPIHGGAMENSGLIVFDDTLLLLNDDAPISQISGFGVVMAHELAHMWFGNLVTPRWWDDIWLNESFANWMGNLGAARWRPDIGVAARELSGALGAMSDDSQAVGRPIRQPITNSADINSAFDSITYAKGGQVIRMMNGYTGADAFQKGVRLHLDRHRNGTATADEFFRNIADGAGNPQVVPAFRSFVEQEGVPLVTLAPAGSSYRLTQSRYRPIGVSTPDTRWTIPVCASSGEGRACTLLAGKEGRLPAVTGTAPWVHPNADGAGYYRFALPQAEWDRLIASAATLPTPEAMTAADSLFAGFLAGAAGFDQVLAGTRAFIGHPERDVAEYLLYDVAAIVARTGSPQDRENARAFIRKTAEPRLETLGLNPARGVYAAEPPSRRQLRQALAAYVANEGRSPAVSETLATAARKSLAGDAAALDPAYRPSALRAALRADPSLAPKLLEALVASDDPLFRRHAANALGAEGGTAILSSVTDKRLQNLEALSLLAGQFASPDGRHAALAWLDTNFDAVKPRLGGLLGQFVGVAGGFCSEADADEVNRVFRPRMSEIGAGMLDLDRTVAGIRQCAALKKAKGAEISAALAAAASR
jgi:aminopeptidase N